MEIRLVDDAVSQQCNDFQNRLHRSGRTFRQWRWTFAENLYQDRPVPYAIARDGDRIIGTQALIPIQMIDREGIYWTAKSEETLLDPAYRGSGIFQDLYRLLFEYAEQHQFACIWGLTSSPAAIKALTRLGFTATTRVNELVMPFWNPANAKYRGGQSAAANDDVVARARALIRRTGYTLAATISSLRFAVQQPRGLPSVELHTLPNADEIPHSISERFVQSWGGATIFRSPGYLQWRLFDNPYLKSIVRGGYEDDKLLGWVAYSMSDDGAGYLVDLFVPRVSPDDRTQQIVRMLLADAIVGCRNMGATSLRLWHVNGHPFDTLVYRIARHLGFFNARAGDTCIVYPCAAGSKRTDGASFDEWYVNRMFTEGVSG